MAVSTYKAMNDVFDICMNEYDEEAAPKPRFTKVWDEKSVAFTDNGDQVLVKPVRENVQYFDLYGAGHLHEPVIELDVYTYGIQKDGEERHVAICDEIDRMLKDRVRRNEDTTFVDLRIVLSKTLSMDYRNRHRHIFHVAYRDYQPHTFT
jgi:hypothetical protein